MWFLGNNSQCDVYYKDTFCQTLENVVFPTKFTYKIRSIINGIQIICNKEYMGNIGELSENWEQSTISTR